MKDRNYIITGILAILFILGLNMGCRKPHLLSNIVYLAAASNTNTSKLIVDSSGTKMDIIARTAELVNNDLTINYAITETALEDYNEKNRTKYKQLPSQYYSLSSNTAGITSGSAFSDAVILEVEDMNGLPESEKYAIPITISDVKGNVPVLESSKTIIVLLDRVIYTSVPYLSRTSIDATFKKPFKNLTAWTFEWRAQMDALRINNQALIYASPSEVYTRFGDVVIRPTQLQVKTAGLQFSPDNNFLPGTWYNFALVYNGSTLKWYKDGNIILNVSLNATYDFESIGFGNSTGSEKANEIRFWTIARTQSEIVNNMYAVNPDADGLAGYWKLNEGSGSTFKDATKNKNDMVASSSNVEWIKGVRMPAIK